MACATKQRRGGRGPALLAGTFVVFAVLAAAASAPYWWPLGIGLGPCGRDWTSPSSYLPRQSPTRSLAFQLAGARGAVNGKICYGSPALRGRKGFGGVVAWDRLWRTGANEPTRLFVDAPIEVAGIALEPGRYSLYTLPRQETWRLFVNRSVFHWGNDIGDAVRAQELGSATLEPLALAEAVENLRFLFVAADAPGSVPASGELRLEWERTAITIPLRAR